MDENNKNFIRALIFTLLFVLFTAAVCLIGKAAIGPEGSVVGFSGINRFFFETFPKSALLESITKYLGYLALLIAAGFAALGVLELVTKKSLKRVDPGLLTLGALYAAVALFYAVFNVVAVNYRPVLENGALESSYPSSHTMLALCVFISASIQISRGKASDSAKRLVKIILTVIAALVTVLRLLSGVHWFTDIIGGLLLSMALLSCYYAAIKYLDNCRTQAGSAGL